MALTRRFTPKIEPSRVMRATGFDWDHTIEIALPASYDETDRTYPVLWLTDGPAYFGGAVDMIDGLSMSGLAPEMFIVGVGPDRDLNMAEAGRRRSYDLSPTPEIFYEGLGGDRLRQLTEDAGWTGQAGGGPQFLDFLVGDVRSALSAEYRMDPADHAIFGHSGGGMFVGYALFARPGSFAKYICGSPSLNAGNFEIFKMEERYAASNVDLPARVFFGAGEQEIDDPGNAMWSLVGSMIRLAETLRLRDYSSLHVTSRIFPGETHITTVWPLLSWGVRTLWASGRQ